MLLEVYLTLAQDGVRRSAPKDFSIPGQIFILKSCRSTGSAPYYIVHHAGILSYSAVQDVLRVGTGGDDTLGILLPGVGQRFFGHEGNDTLTGDTGNDTFTGGSGDDRLQGGRGRDIYHLSPADADTILDDGYGANIRRRPISCFPGKPLFRKLAGSYTAAYRLAA